MLGPVAVPGFGKIVGASGGETQNGSLANTPQRHRQSIFLPILNL
jgi:hypothetical protein